MNSRAARPDRLTFKAFLSHRYKSEHENLAFYRLFSQVANVHFEADVGDSATSVTKLERMIRNADAFVGIYPFPESFEKSRNQQELRRASRYFRLELDLAIRSRKPSIVFYDQRYKDTLRLPEGGASYPFDTREIADGLSRREAIIARSFKGFCETVRISMAHEAAFGLTAGSRVGLVVPPPSARSAAYSPKHVAAIRAMLAQHGFTDVSQLKWPPRLDRQSLAELEGLNFAVVDVGPETSCTGIPAYLHGRFVPMLRLRHLNARHRARHDLDFEHVLRDSVEVGYAKDILTWTDISQLNRGLNGRLLSLQVESDEDIRFISNVTDAEDYFRSASQRSEPIFISYAGRDMDLVSPICKAFSSRFRNVFDYKDGASIQPGREWQPEIFDRLASCAVGLPMLSPNYFLSGNCKHEAQMMAARYDEGGLKLLPVKLTDAKLELPTWLPPVQYQYLWRTNPEQLVSKVVLLLEGKKESPLPVRR